MAATRLPIALGMPVSGGLDAFLTDDGLGTRTYFEGCPNSSVNLTNTYETFGPGICDNSTATLTNASWTDIVSTPAGTPGYATGAIVWPYASGGTADVNTRILIDGTVVGQTKRWSDGGVINSWSSPSSEYGFGIAFIGTPSYVYDGTGLVISGYNHAGPIYFSDYIKIQAQAATTDSTVDMAGWIGYFHI